MSEERMAFLSDECLLEGCLKRDDVFREGLYRKYAKDLFQCALRYTGNVEDAEDVLQEAFLLIFERIAQYSGKGSLLAWMRTIVVREALRLYQKHTVRHRKDIPIEDSPEDLSEDVATQIGSKLDYQCLLRLIQQLPEGYRIVFNLCEIEGYSYEEAAEMMHCSQANCRSQLSRAKSRLRAQIAALDLK